MRPIWKQTWLGRKGWYSYIHMTHKMIALGLLLIVVLAVGAHILDANIGVVIAWALIVYALGPLRIVRGLWGLIRLVTLIAIGI